MNRAENHIYAALLLILADASLLYGHTLDVPFYLDDYNALVNHYVLRDLPASLDRIFTRAASPT